MSGMSMELRDTMSPAMRRLIKKTRNMTPAMKKIETKIIKPMKSTAWAGSGLKSHSGELQDSVKTWHGKKSTGLSVHSSPGRDLIIPKAVAQLRGAKKHAYRKHQRIRVKRHSRSGRRIKGYIRTNKGAPWGKVKARKFLPTRFTTAETLRIRKILTGFINVRS